MKKFFIYFLVSLSSFFADQTIAQDSVDILGFKDFIYLVANNHPVVRQAELLSEQARQEIRIAKSAFDPVIESKYYRKSFKGNNYFTIWENNLRIPLWYGVDVLAGYENNGGPNIDPEDLTTPKGLTSVGLSIPLGQNLIIDERRATLRRARLLEDISEAEQVKVINKLLLDAAKQYWDWVLAWETLLYTEEGLEFAEFRLEATKEKARRGATSPVDTIEAEVLLQDFAVALEKASLQYNNATLILSTYLWSENLEPLEIPEAIIPSNDGWEIEPIQKDSLQELLVQAMKNHPEVLTNELKLQQLRIQREYYSNLFLPKLSVDVSVLQTGFAPPRIFDSQFIRDNHKIKISFEQPLFFRKARGQENLYQVKIKEAKYDLMLTNVEITAKVNRAFESWQSFENQIRFQTRKVRNYFILREAELEKFDLGAGTLFLINKREMSLVENQIKLAKIRAKYAKNKYFLQWAAGNLLNTYNL